MTLRIVVVIMALALALGATKKVKFTADQCRVMKQLKINTKGLCDPPPS
jgi:hypothetical protein